MGIVAIMFGVPAWISLAILSLFLIEKGGAGFDRPLDIKVSKYIPPGLVGYAISTSILTIVAVIAAEISMRAQVISFVFALVFPLVTGAIFVTASVTIGRKSFFGWWVNSFGIGFYFCTLFLPATIFLIHTILGSRG